jgi:hypothetical protein
MTSYLAQKITLITAEMYHNHFFKVVSWHGYCIACASHIKFFMIFYWSDKLTFLVLLASSLLSIFIGVFGGT